MASCAAEQEVSSARASGTRGKGRRTHGMSVREEDGVDLAQAVLGPVLYCATVERLAALCEARRESAAVRAQPR